MVFAQTCYSNGSFPLSRSAESPEYLKNDVIVPKLRFHITVNHMQDLPDTRREIAFVGRSNAGKSGALNTLANHVRLAYVSKTPGRTSTSIIFTG